MKTYMKPVLEVREVRVSENIAASNLWNEAVWTKYNMLTGVDSAAQAAKLNDLKFAD